MVKKTRLFFRFILIFFLDINQIKFTVNTQVEEDSRPNIVILIADDLGYGDLSPFGNKTIPTPNFDKLAKTGVKFTHHLTAASLCTPSRAALLTGRLPIRYGLASPWLTRVFLFVASSGGLPQSEKTFAKVLKKNNYKTALIGKWHLGNYCSSKSDQCHNPTKHGFDYFYGTSLTNLKDFGSDGSSVVISFFPLFKHTMFFLIFTLATIMTCSLLFDFSIFGKRTSKFVKWTTLVLSIFGILLTLTLLLFQKNITRFNSILMRNEKIIEQPIQMETLTDRILNESLSFITKQYNDNQRFLLMTSFLKVHTAHFPSTNFSGKSKHGKYGDCIMELDYAVGRIIDRLEQLKIRDNTFIYFSSDNGGHLEEYNVDHQYEGGYNGQFKGGKGHSAMEGGIRVPAIVSWPKNGENRQNEESKVVTSQMDLFPTLVELIGDKENLDNLDGESFLDLLKINNTNTSKERFLFHYCGAYLHGARYVQDQNHIYKIHFNKPKYVSETEFRCEFVCRCTDKYTNKLNPPEIYDLVNDPFENEKIEVNSNLFNELLLKFNDAIDRHKKTINTDVENQLSLSNIIWRPQLQPCCSFPFCTCRESV